MHAVETYAIYGLRKPVAITVRSYRSDDLSRIREILTQMPSPTGHTYDAGEIIKESLRAQPDGVFVATLNNEIGGLAVMLFDTWYEVAYLDYLIVDPKYHRQGVGAALMAKCLAWAKGKKGRVFYTDTASDNNVAIDFYRGHGLTVCGRIPNFFRKGIDKVTLACDLESTKRFPPEPLRQKHDRAT